MGHDISFTEVVLVQYRTSFDLLDDILTPSQYDGAANRMRYCTHGVFQYSLLYIPLNSKDKLQQKPQEHHAQRCVEKYLEVPGNNVSDVQANLPKLPTPRVCKENLFWS